jgi:glycosyltransferase involved in cell wall biosynthesis
MKDNTIKLLWVGDAVSQTGFARVTHGVLGPLFARGDYDIHVLGVNYNGDPHDYSYKIYPARLGGDLLGYGRLEKLVTHIKPDVIVVFNDIWVILEYFRILEEMKYEGALVTYFPVDSEGYDPEWVKPLYRFDRVFVYTNFAGEVLKQAGFKRRAHVIPHGIDTSIYFPMDQKEARRQLNGLDDSDFIVFNGNRNQPRKRIDVTVKGFCKFAADKPNARLYLHMGLIDTGWNIIGLMERECKKYDIDDMERRLIITHPELSPATAVSEDHLNIIYNTADVGLNTCYTPDTKVLTGTGFRPISDIKIGDKVFNHKGNLDDVINRFSYERKDIELLRITPYGAFPFELTPNHELFADIRPYTKTKRNYKNEIRENPQLRFVRADHLFEGSVLTFPVIKEETASFGADQAFIFGAYLAEGSTSKAGIRFSLNSGEPDDYLRQKILENMKKVFGLEGHVFNYSRNRQTIEFYSMKLKKAFEEMFNTGARNKRLPQEMHFLKREEKLALLKAYFLGDGHLSNKSRTLSFSTTSESLAWSTWWLLTTLGRIAPSIEQAKRGDWKIKVCGQSADRLASLFELDLREAPRQQRDKMWADNDYVYYPIRKIEKITYTGKIYDLSVVDEKSYVTHVAGHNSMGEGWGLVPFEQATCGVPQIVTNYAASAEIFKDRGLLLPIRQRLSAIKINTEGGLVHEDDVAEALNTYYYDSKLRDKHASDMYEYVMQDKFRWENIAAIWDEHIKELII